MTMTAVMSLRGNGVEGVGGGGVRETNIFKKLNFFLNSTNHDLCKWYIVYAISSFG